LKITGTTLQAAAAAALFLLAGCATDGSRGNRQLAPVTYRPPAGTALVVFFHALDSMLDEESRIPMRVGIFDRERCLGVVSPAEEIAIAAAPGEHLFFAVPFQADVTWKPSESDRSGFVEASVRSDRVYYVRIRAQVGVFRTVVRLIPVAKEVSDGTLDSWIASTRRFEAVDASIAWGNQCGERFFESVRRLVESEHGKPNESPRLLTQDLSR